MSASPRPSRRNNNLNRRSRSPSPAAHVVSHSNNMAHNTSTANARDIFLNPINSNLVRPTRDVNSKDLNTGAESIPLIDTELIEPPLANPEVDDFGDDKQGVDTPYPGIDDGFFSNRLNPDGPTVPETANGGSANPPDGSSVDDPDGRRIPSRNPMSPSYPFPDLELGTIPDLESIPDVNVYQHKKTLAQGMMDLALFSANANQLRYVLESDSHPYYYAGVILISFSLVLQVLIGVGLIWNSRYNVKDDKEICIANKINNSTIIGIFLVTVVNVFISAFGVASVQPVIAAPASNP